MELNVKIDGLEVYAINAFQVQGATPNRIMLFFRPMSLKKSKPLKESGEIDALEIAPISPNLTKDHIHVIINEEKVKIYEINKVFEDRGDNKKLISYLIHVGLPKNLNKYEYNKITITLYDSETHERGEGSLFWKADEVI
ncbi:hypothetical protein [Haloimpatiens massiliensis]|uniref:hypothetical protein n=1 Tax=Haloimpatiens massiliensis TaxID=1658110 RepID=UPI001A9A321D|nr:hypothetical protein [Haloimpatiens massiliensis]